MSGYKEDTVGWWLDRLKEPLRSRAFRDFANQDMNQPAKSMAHTIALMKDSLEWRAKSFWIGAGVFFDGQWKDVSRYNGGSDTGWDMAKECAPEPSIVGNEIGVEGTPPGRLNVVKDLGALGEGKLPAGDGPENQASHFAPKSGGFIDPDSAMKSKIAVMEARVSLLEDTLAAFIQFVNENLCDGGEFTH